MLDIVELSRLQFALTAMYHFLFVPLTLGMAFLLAIMETVYVLSGKQIYKDMTTSSKGQVVWYQLRSGCGYRSDHGVPVRD